SLMLNSLVIIICLKRRSHLVSSDYFIVNLAVCDLILSVIGLPFGITSSFTHKWLFGSYGCQAYGFMGFFCGVVSISTLAMMSFSRYINVCKMNKDVGVRGSKEQEKIGVLGEKNHAKAWVVDHLPSHISPFAESRIRTRNLRDEKRPPHHCANLAIK
ncbi:hypothetical protein FSP39_006294, partial [Pinctada imbricata]